MFSSAPERNHQSFCSRDMPVFQSDEVPHGLWRALDAATKMRFCFYSR